MKYILCIFTILSVCFSISPATAQNKVVVVPLGGKKCTSPTENTFTNTIGMTFNLIPAGKFTMGSPADEPGRFFDEAQHQVSLTKPFHMQVTEVTQQQWMDVIGNNTAFFKTSTEHPLETVTWYDAAFFANALSVREGRSQCYTLTGCSPIYPEPGGSGMSCTGVSINAGCTGYRLPTEAQWEYAARAGTTTAYANPYSFDATNEETGTGFNANLAAMGWYAWNDTIYGYEHGTKPVAQQQPNLWGIYDMHGNVQEWCQDNYDYYPEGSVIDPQGAAEGTTRVIRGGSWTDSAKYTRSAARYSDSPYSNSFQTGFRLTLPSGQ